MFPEGSDKSYTSNYRGQLNQMPSENNSFTTNNNFPNARAIPLSLRHGIGSRLQVVMYKVLDYVCVEKWKKKLRYTVSLEIQIN